MKGERGTLCYITHKKPALLSSQKEPRGTHKVKKKKKKEEAKKHARAPVFFSLSSIQYTRAIR